MPRKFTPKQHQPYVFVNACHAKRQYRSEKDAIRTAEYQMLISPSVDLSVYHCHICRQWHLTSQDAKNS